MALINYAEAINDLANDIANAAEGKGFWDPDGVGDMGIIPVKLVLIDSEVAEALEVHRNEYDDSDEDPLHGMTEMQTEDFTEELADVVIRALDLGGYFDLPLGEVIVSKMEKNRSRPYRHGKRY